MRVLIVSFEYPPIVGGAGAHARNLALGFAKVGVDTAVLTWDFGRADDGDDGSFPFPVIRLPISDIAKRTDWLKAAASLKGWLRRNARYFDIALLIEWRAQVLFNLVRGGNNIPYVASVLGSEVNAYRDSRWLGYATRGLYKNARYLVCISDYTRDLLHTVFPELLRENSVAIPVPVWFPSVSERASARNEIRRKLCRNEEFLLVQVGRLVARKGHDVVIEALAHGGCENVHYAIVGGGPLEPALRQMAADMEVADRVTFIGRIGDSDLPEYYDMADVFVGPSLEKKGAVEGFGIVFVEAALRGLPSIGARHGGVQEVVVHEETGLLVTPGDPVELAAAISRLYNGRDELRRMGEQAQKRAVALYSPEVVAAQMRALLERVR